MPAQSQPRGVTVSPQQEQVLTALMGLSGTAGFRPLFRAAFGFRWDDVAPTDRNRYFSNLRAMEKKGLLTISRRWGSWGYGQPELVAISDAGRDVAAPPSSI